MSDETSYSSDARSEHWLEGWIRHPVAVLAWAVAILIAGVWSAAKIPLEWVPQVELQEVRIAAFWPGASPRVVERYVTAPIERAVQTVAGTERIESLSQEGSTSITLKLLQSTDLGLYVARINEQLTLLRETLPDRVTPRLTKQIPPELQDEQGFMSLQLIGPLSPDELRRMADRRIKPKLQSIPGIAEVSVSGGTRRELRITLDPDRLSAFRIGPAQIRSRIFDLLSDDDYGRLRGKGRSTLLIRSSEDDIDRIRDTIIHTSPDGQIQVRLKDVAAVQLVPAPVVSISRIDGLPVIKMRLDRARASHLVAVAEAVRASVARQRRDLQEGVRLIVVDDRSTSIREQLHDLLWRGGAGLLLVVLVLLVMLRSVRATMVVLFSVGVALAVAFILLNPLGLTLNLLTIAGLVLVFGLLVDNAVVVTEQLQEHPALEALRAVWLPLLGSTLSTMAVMAPLIYLSGNLQDLFLPFGILVSLALAASLAAAALVVPVAARIIPTRETVPTHNRLMRRIISTPYRWAARFPRLTILSLVLLLGVPFWKLPTRIQPSTEVLSDDPAGRLTSVYNGIMDTGVVRDARAWLDPVLGGILRPFVRSVTFGSRWNFQARPEVYVRLSFPPGHPIARADSLMNQFELEALSSPSVSQTIAEINEESAYLRVQFVDGALETAEPYMLRERLIGRAVNVGGIYISVFGLVQDGYSSGFGGITSGIRIEARGPNYEDLEALSVAFAEQLKSRSRRVASVDINSTRYGRFGQSRQVLRFGWTADAAARSGISSRDLAATLRPVFSTRFPVAYADLSDEVQTPVRIIVKGAETIDIDRFSERSLQVSDSVSIRLAGLADYTIEERPSGVRRVDQQYQRTILMDFRGPFTMADKFLERELAAFPVPVGYHLEKSTFSFFTDEVQRAFWWVILATILMVFLITSAVFESWTLPLVVMLSVPMAGIGVAAGFLWTGANFAEGAFIGSVLMVGIAVNDSILLVDRYRHLKALRSSTRSSLLVRLAVRDRLRPMFTTTLTSIVAMLPLLLFPDDGDFWTGLAATVVGGLTASTLLAPLISVAALSWRERPGYQFTKWKRR